MTLAIVFLLGTGCKNTDNPPSPSTSTQQTGTQSDMLEKRKLGTTKSTISQNSNGDTVKNQVTTSKMTEDGDSACRADVEPSVSVISITDSLNNVSDTDTDSLSLANEAQITRNHYGQVIEEVENNKRSINLPVLETGLQELMEERERLDKGEAYSQE